MTKSRNLILPRVPFPERLTALSAQYGAACWLWPGKLINGYGVIRYGGRKHVRAHRAAYEMLRGPIQEGMVIDHLCRNRRCINPAHMEIVTRGENVLRGIGPAAENTRKAQCPNGHPYTTRKNGTRHCKVCDKAKHQARMKDPARRARVATYMSEMYQRRKSAR